VEVAAKALLYPEPGVEELLNSKVSAETEQEVP